MSTETKDEGVFENVEFVEPHKEAMEQPSHPFIESISTNNNENTRKRKDHPSPNMNDDEFAKPPPPKRAKTSDNHNNQNAINTQQTQQSQQTQEQHPGYSSIHQHHRKHKPSNYYQRKFKKHDGSTMKSSTYYHQPTLQEMETHPLFKIAKQNWLNHTNTNYKSSLIDSLYYDHISSQNEACKHNIIILEFSHYLENYLWKYFDYELSSDEHLLSMLYFINQKFNEHISVWDTLINTRYHDYAQSVKNNKENNEKMNGNMNGTENTSKDNDDDDDDDEEMKDKQEMISMEDIKNNKARNMEKLSLFFKRIFEVKLVELDRYLNDNKSERIWDINEKANFLLFLINCFYKMENESVRKPILKLIGLPLFEYINNKQRERIFSFVPSLTKSWKKFIKNKSKINRYQKELYHLLLKEFFIILKETESLHKLLKDTKNTENNTNKQHQNGYNANLDTLSNQYCNNLNYIYHFQQLIIDNLCILMTRRYLRPFLESSSILFMIQCKYLVSPLLYGDDNLFHSLMDKISFYLHFEIDDFDGRSLTDNEMRLESYHKFVILQKCIYKYFYDKLQEMALCTISTLDNYDKLKMYLNILNSNDLYELSVKLQILPSMDINNNNNNNLISSLLKENSINTTWTEKELLIEILINHHLSRKSKREQIHNLPLYPTEEILFDDVALYLNDRNRDNNNSKILSLDKLNLQFLTIYDYLLRNYNLYKLESAHSIRDDIAKCIWKIRPRLKRNPNTSLRETVFTGYSRMAVPIDEFAITAVNKPDLGENKPSKVIAEITVDLKPFHDDILKEWKELKENDVLFLIRLRGIKDIELQFDQYLNQQNNKQKQNEFGVGNKRWDELSKSELGILYVRGCQIIRIRDGDNPNNIIGENNNNTKRIYDVELDTAQYQIDITAMVEMEDNNNNNDVYSNFNLLIRRKGKENNFKYILNTITSLMDYSNNMNVWQDRNGNNDNNMNITRDGMAGLLPKWFQRLFLGYDDPQNASYWNIHKKLIAAPNIASKFVKNYDEYMDEEEEEEDIDINDDDHEDNMVITSYKDIVKKYYCLDFKDSFIDLNHVKSSFPGMKVKLLEIEDNNNNKEKIHGPPYRLWFNKKNIQKPNYDKILQAALNGEEIKNDDDNDDGVVIVESYYDKKRDFYGYDGNKCNSVRYTPIQIEAIKSGMHWGLTMVVGPPGSGKTDVAVQILNNLYSNFGCNERILLVTHSNQALNDLFEKLIERDIDERDLLRLGYGYKKLQENIDNKFNFSIQGRIDYMLNDRNNKLEIAQYLASTLNISENSGYCYTAETCAHFKNMVLMNLWENFIDDLDEIEYKYADKLNENEFIIKEFNISINKIIDRLFPFKMFIQHIQSIYNNDNISIFVEEESYSFNKSLAYKYWQYILSIFSDIAKCHVFELLRTTKDRREYLLTRQSKIVAMTCTHAAIKRDNFLLYNFEFDTLMMEESGQILDIETFIPMVLQKNNNRLKRIILIGDHYQLPPIIKNNTFSNYSKLDESLFHRLIRLGTPFNLLNMNGRCRSNIRCLWSWRYPYNMGDLQYIHNKHGEYKYANTGFYYDYQLIHVDNYLGLGEFEPNPYFYQNLDEAQYIVNCYQYMRLLGYPAEKITILTTYNGQKHLLKEIFNKKCCNDPLFGIPSRITTVDKYQGSQNHFILLSLVRTKSIGYIRDIRRLIVSLSRSRFGLYIFANCNLFKQCYELKKAFNLLLKRPNKLIFVTNESYPTDRILETKLNSANYNKPNIDGKREYFEVEGIEHLMYIVNTMGNNIRNHFKNEYKEKLNQYKKKAIIALKEKRKNDEKEKQKIIHLQIESVDINKKNVDHHENEEDEEEEEKEDDDNNNNKKNKKSDKEEMDVSDESDDDNDKKKENELITKEQFDLAAEMALIRSNQNIYNEDEEDDGDNDDDESSSHHDDDDDDDDNIEYESSSNSSSEQE